MITTVMLAFVAYAGVPAGWVLRRIAPEELSMYRTFMVWLREAALIIPFYMAFLAYGLTAGIPLAAYLVLRTMGTAPMWYTVLGSLPAFGLLEPALMTSSLFVYGLFQGSLASDGESYAALGWLSVMHSGFVVLAVAVQLIL
jgi:hypothetical protein